MENFTNIWNAIVSNNIFKTACVIITSLLCYILVARIVQRGQNTKRAQKMSSRGRTYIRLIMNLIRYLFIALTILTVLQVNGVNITSLLAGLGLVGVIIGLAVQDALKDIIRGFSIASDNYFDIGDVIRLKNGTEGRVVSLGIRSTKIKDLRTNNISSIANRNIEEAEVLANCIYLRIPLPYELKVAESDAIMNEICEEATKDELIKSCQYLGTAELADSSIEHLLFIECDAVTYLKSRRLVIRKTLQTLEKHHVSIPYSHLDVTMTK